MDAQGLERSLEEGQALYAAVLSEQQCARVAHFSGDGVARFAQLSVHLLDSEASGRFRAMIYVHITDTGRSLYVRKLLKLLY